MGPRRPVDDVGNLRYCSAPGTVSPASSRCRLRERSVEEGGDRSASSSPRSISSRTSWVIPPPGCLFLSAAVPARSLRRLVEVEAGIADAKWRRRHSSLSGQAPSGLLQNPRRVASAGFHPVPSRPHSAQRSVMNRCRHTSSLGLVVVTAAEVDWRCMRRRYQGRAVRQLHTRQPRSPNHSGTGLFSHVPPHRCPPRRLWRAGRLPVTLGSAARSDLVVDVSATASHRLIAQGNGGFAVPR